MALDLDALLSATEAAWYANVSVNVIVNWRNRGHLPPATDPGTGQEIHDDKGCRLYRLLDVAKAEYATRLRGQVMARGILRAPPPD